MTQNVMGVNHPANGPLSDERIVRVQALLEKAAEQSDGGNLGYAMADAVKGLGELQLRRKTEDGAAVLKNADRLSVIHGLKIGPLYFNAVSNGEKKAELRINDRNYQCGDFLLLREWAGEYSGNKLVVRVTHILPLEGFVSVGGNWVMMSIAHIDENDIQAFMEAAFGGDE